MREESRRERGKKGNVRGDEGGSQRSWRREQDPNLWGLKATAGAVSKGRETTGPKSPLPKVPTGWSHVYVSL